MSEISQYRNQFVQGDAIETMRSLLESSVNAVVMSPPYWALRSYQSGAEPIESVIGGHDCCEHEWLFESSGRRCCICGAWKGQFGLEPTPDQYVANMVEVGRAVRQVLRPDGSWWLNLGDTYSGGGGVAGKPDEHDDMHIDEAYPESVPARDTEYGRKNKLLIPHRVAIALQEDGWTVRNDITWDKNGSEMPYSCTDRLNTATEMLFHLTPNPDYWYDVDKIKEPYAEASENDGGGKVSNDVFRVTTANYSDAHFAVMPTELIEKPVQATVPTETCANCGTPENDCSCETDASKPGVVLDPFVGAGTTAVVAETYGVDWIGIDISQEYVEMARERMQNFRANPGSENVTELDVKREVQANADKPDWWD